MQKSDFRGVFPAITTKMTADQEVDLAGVRADVTFQIEAGVDGIIICGSLGEASSLSLEEKLAIAKAALEAAAGRKPILLTIAEDSTRTGASLAAAAEKLGIAGLMVLPAMRYLADDREVVAHYRAIAAASSLPIIVYNNPIAYGINITTAMLEEMADEPKFVAVKESTGDTRRINETLSALGDRYQLLTGVDDLALESLVLGCSGWIAGLVVAFPRETVAIYKLVQARPNRRGAGNLPLVPAAAAPRYRAEIRPEHQAGRKYRARHLAGDAGAPPAARRRRGSRSARRYRARS